MTKAEQDSLILDALDMAVKTARVFYPDAKQFSMSWVDSETGEYIQINNSYYELDDDREKLSIFRKAGSEYNEFPNGGDQTE